MLYNIPAAALIDSSPPESLLPRTLGTRLLEHQKLPPQPPHNNNHNQAVARRIPFPDMHVLTSFFGANFGSFGGLSEAQKEQRRAGLDTWIIRVVTEMVGRLL